jgi:thiol-disulfide isomerase/thioredoxin
VTLDRRGGNWCWWLNRSGVVALLAASVLITNSDVFAQSPPQQPSTPPAPAAETLLNAALRTAAAENKVVFIVFGASWCPPCRELDAFLDSPGASKVLSRHYVLLHLTIWENNDKSVLNNPGAEDLFQKLGGRDGIPFVAFTDKAGHTIASGNLDAPDQSAERRKLLAFFDRTAPHLSADERAALRIDLRNGLSAIAGRVFDGLGQPVAGADVSLITGSYSHSGQWTPVWGPRTQTDAAGRYVLEDIPPGDYRLLAVADARSGVATLNLAPRREETGIDVRLEPMRRATVSGAVTGPDGAGIASGSVTLTNLDRPNDSHEAQIGSDGAFNVRDVPPGRYNLWVRATAPPESTSLAGMQPVLVSAPNVPNLKVAAKKGALLTGRVAFQGGSMSAADRAAILITTVATPPEAGAPRADAKMGPDDRFQVRDVFGSRVIRVTHLPSGWELQSVRLNGEDITNKPIDFSGMGTIGGISITATYSRLKR